MTLDEIDSDHNFIFKVESSWTWKRIYKMLYSLRQTSFTSIKFFESQQGVNVTNCFFLIQIIDERLKQCNNTNVINF